ncbi:MAG: methylmalonyl-CoA mutase family protein [Alphaproteobacteria bacterium]|nr:methylmalonyl-CoA mutase family protein [Alphaproteobacteria bacterium]
MSPARRPEDGAQLALPGFETAREDWRRAYRDHLGGDDEVRNRSRLEIEPLYTPEHWPGGAYMEDLGFPGAYPFTRGIYPSMHRGRPWSQRLIVGLGFPEDYNRRQRAMTEAGVSGLYIAPCNSFMRGYDMDEVEPALLGTCGTVINTTDHLAACLDGLRLEGNAMSLGDNAPFTLSAMILALARRRGVPWSALSGTTNQSDYLSLYVANHMFFRLALPGSRRLLTDLIVFMNRHVPSWNPLSVVGQHMQQAGATPAEAMGFTLSSAIQHAEDCTARGLAPDSFLPRFSFFFDISLSFFEEIAKFRAGRRVWARIARRRLGALEPRSWRLRYHSQTSGCDLTRQQPLNNIARVAVQAAAGILGGTQSLHTDGYDEALSSPSAEAARIAAHTQNILHEEAGLGDVIDPLGGAYYVEALTERMEDEIEAVIARVDQAGGMFRAVRSGLVQRLIGESALRAQRRVEAGEQTVVGVNKYRVAEDAGARSALQRPEMARVEAAIARFKAAKAARSGRVVARALDALSAAANDPHENVFEKVVEAAEAGVTHGEICARLRAELGFGQPLVMA